MNSNNRCSTSVCASALLAVASLTFSPAARALGLGDVKVESYLNQPLKARIDLITQASDDLASVTAQLASAADYELIGASREAVSVPIRFSVENIDGDAYILATSTLPLGDPVLRLIVEVNWSSGRMLREYTLFLDPPVVSEPAPAPRIDRRQDQAAPERSPESAPERAPASTAAPSAAEASPPSATSVPQGAAEYGPVRSGQTLWGIASDWSRGAGLDVNTVMIAIQRENPNAFLNDNINLLKRGAILRMPDVAEVQAIPRATAYQEVASQSEAFKGRAATATVASPDTPLLSRESAAVEIAAEEPAPAAPAPAAETATAETPTTADDAPADDTAAPEETVPAEEGAAEPAADASVAMQDEVAEAVPEQDLLELVPPSEDSELASDSGLEAGAESAGADLRVLREELARKEEELITQQQQNAYLEERLQELETQLQDANEGRIANADVANMEDGLREQRQAVQRAQSEPASPWYSRLSVWLVALLVLAAGFVGWLLSRRGRSGEAVGVAQNPLRDIKSEAEDVLRVLGDDRARPAAAEAAGVAAGTTPAGTIPVGLGDEAQAAGSKPAERFAHVEDAELLDEESSDPEIQLDLARAYISMGDKEAARVILEEVVTNGSEGQQVEARKMLDLLT